MNENMTLAAVEERIRETILELTVLLAKAQEEYAVTSAMNNYAEAMRQGMQLYGYRVEISTLTDVWEMLTGQCWPPASVE